MKAFLHLFFFLIISISYNALAQDNYVGIGVALNKNLEDQFVVITKVLPNGPADKGGIKLYDKILAIGIEKVGTHTLREVTDLIRGEVGSTVDIRIERKGSEQMLSILREKIQKEKFAGCLRGDCQNGKGTFAYPDGSTYTGQFVNGKRKGAGTLTNDTLTVICNYWSEDKTASVGEIIYKDESKWKGGFDFKTLKPNASGTMYDKTGKDIYDGRVYYHKGEFLGKDRKLWLDKISGTTKVAVKNEEPKKEVKSTTSFESAFKELQNSVGNQITEDNRTSGFSYTRFENKLNGITELYDVLLNKIKAGNDARSKCYRSKGKNFKSIDVHSCEGNFNYTLDYFKTYSPNFTTIFEEALIELRRSNLKTNSPSYKTFSNLKSITQRIDANCKAISSIQRGTVATFALANIENKKLKSHNFVDNNFKKIQSKWKEVINDYYALNKELKIWKTKIRQSCR